MVPEGIPLPKHTPSTRSLLVATLSVGVSSSPPPLILQEEEEEKKEHEEQGFMDLTESVDEFEVFNQPPSPKSLPKEMAFKESPRRACWS